VVSPPPIRRGEIWWASLPEPVASEPGSRRPLLVVQADSFNRSRIQTIPGVSLSTNLALQDAPGNVLLPKEATGLPRDSVANVSQVVTADRRLLTEKVSTLPADLLAEVEEGLLLILDLRRARPRS
jgi:mRNA interferase MazF